MKEIVLTQYMFPRGTPKTVKTDVSDDVAKRAEGMILSCEMLRTGEIAFYARNLGDKKEEEGIEVCPNGPEVEQALEKLIQRTFESKQGVKP